MATSTLTKAIQIQFQAGDDGQYMVTLYADNSWYCTCPGWRFKKVPAEQRKCKHCV